MIKNCYIHIPFCSNICSYCDFCKLYYNEKLVDKYLDALEEEIESIYNNEVLETIYIGGGTPSSLNYEQLERLLKILSKLKVSSNLEYTIEGNFESTDYKKLDLYKKYGINRLSFGIESINKNNLDVLERKLDKDKVNNIIKYARENGFNNINLDLMYAIPSEDIEILKEDLEYIVSLDVEHISTYSLIIEEHTKLSIKNTSNISEDLDYEMYKVICEYLNKNNYKHYEISNFSKEGYYSKHNNCYWENKRYFGFGLGASSYIDNKRINNTRSINKYLDGKYRSDIEVLDDKAMMEYEVILNLRKSNGIDFDLFKQKYEIDLNNVYKYDKLVDMGLLLLKDNCLLIPEDKWYISNEIIVKMLESDENG